MNKTFFLKKVFLLFEKYSWILGIAIIIYAFSIYANFKYELNTNELSTHGKVYDKTYIFNGRFGKFLYRYEFLYNGKKYFGTSSKTGPEVSLEGRVFKVIFSSENPDINEIIFEHEYSMEIKKDDRGIVYDTIYKLKH